MFPVVMLTCYGVMSQNRHGLDVDKTFGDQGLFNSNGPFSTAADRLQVLDKTDTWRVSAGNGNIASFDTMKVSN